MKLKNTLKSKSFVAGSLAVLCVGVLVVYLALPKDEKTEFVPEPTPTITPLQSWTENTTPSTTPTQSEKNTSVSEDTVTSSPKAEEYPKTVENDESKTVVDFTDPSPEKPEAPPAPEGKTEIADPGPSHPVKKESTVTPTPSKKEVKKETSQKTKKETEKETKKETKNKSKSNTPAPGSKNEKGQVYDQVFGWITIEEGVGIPTDNDGDINKQIGSMD